MRKLGPQLVPLAIVIACASQASAQTPASPSPPPTFGVQTAVVHLDVLATDSKGRPVTDLAAADFEIESDGTRYPARLCVYVPVTEALPAGAVLTTNGGKTVKREVRRMVVFVVGNPVVDVWERPDFGASTSQLRPPAPSLTVRTMEAAQRTAEMLTKFVDQQLGPRDLVAIVNASGKQGLLRRFTTDRARLRGAVKDIRENWFNQPPVVIEAASGDASRIVDELVQESLAIVETTSSAVSALAAMPGRKLVFLASPALTIHGHEFEPVRDAIARLVDHANRSAVTIYGIAPLGAGRRGIRSEALDSIALNTGGLTISSNDLVGGLGAVLEENSGYYQLGYEPGGIREAPRKVKVHVQRPGVRVSARRSAFAGAGPAAASEATDDSPILAIVDSPFAAVGLNVRLRPYLRWTDKLLSQLLTVVEVDPSGLEYRADSAGKLSVDLDVVLRVVGERGETLHQASKNVIAHVKGSAVPVSFVLEGDLRGSGSLEADVAVRDRRSLRTGNASWLMERPRDSEKQLQLASLMLRDSSAPESAPTDRFRRDAVLALSCQVKNARADRKSRAVRIQVQARVLHEDRVVASTRPDVLSKPMRAPFVVNGRIPLTGLPPGEYRAELNVLDLASGKAEATAGALFRVTEH